MCQFSFNKCFIPADKFSYFLQLQKKNSKKSKTRNNASWNAKKGAYVRYNIWFQLFCCQHKKESSLHQFPVFCNRNNKHHWAHFHLFKYFLCIQSDGFFILPVSEATTGNNGMCHWDCCYCSLISVHTALIHGENTWANMALEYFPMFQINSNLGLLPKEKKHTLGKQMCQSLPLHYCFASHL